MKCLSLTKLTKSKENGRKRQTIPHRTFESQWGHVTVAPRNDTRAFDLVSAQTLAQVAQGSRGYPISGSIQGLLNGALSSLVKRKVWWGGLEPDDFENSFPIQTFLWFYDFLHTRITTVSDTVSPTEGLKMNILISTSCTGFGVHMDWQCIHTHCKHLVVEGFSSEGSNLEKMPEEEHLLKKQTAPGSSKSLLWGWKWVKHSRNMWISRGQDCTWLE